ncbi:GSCFA domain-containing protein [Rhizobium skierniewicense]|uniref:GSCFA domain-containing protein n=1 Tax=Rhizobium skierniewicense TaxID=984260 RepID=UPI0015731AA7|nr:GSCFA domain-containing protein [Rhizobium skierniewicense]NTF30940.1 GSCFA domain-containing protein [Rhizobium skierniewicense]
MGAETTKNGAAETHGNSHPYGALPERAIWRKAVAETHAMQLDKLYHRKFDISTDMAISTAGSCFAQHIATSLTKNGFGFRDFEPAPPLFPRAMAKAYNYGVYSARYCNIYSARQLVQTFDRAFGRFVPEEPAWIKGEGVVDPFRPLLEPEPFDSVAEMERARHAHLAATRMLFEKTDVFVFTLGLTEAWVSKRDGAVLPLCPGTVAGRFDDSDYEFKNFNYFEIFEDLVGFITRLREINANVKFVLTVSPVPLTATKSDHHVLAASLYSKSVLRAVAGHIADEAGFVDYFPSYEIIAAPSMRGIFYDPNLRTVTPSGVDYVMSHFFREHRGRQAPTTPAATETITMGDHEAVCEEMMQAQELGYA